MLANRGSTPPIQQSGPGDTGLLATLGFQVGSKRHYAIEGSVFVTGATVQWLREHNHPEFDYLVTVQQLTDERNREAEGVTDQEERQEIRDAPIDPDDLPAFAPVRPRLADNLVALQTDLSILLVLNGLFFLGAYSGFLRYDLMK